MSTLFNTDINDLDYVVVVACMCSKVVLCVWRGDGGGGVYGDSSCTVKLVFICVALVGLGSPRARAHSRSRRATILNIAWKPNHIAQKQASQRKAKHSVKRKATQSTYTIHETKREYIYLI